MRLSKVNEKAIRDLCFGQAKHAKCQKLRFGAVLADVRYGAVALLAQDCNGPLGPIAHLCQPTCIRLGIQSRTESMIGACAHAEERALWSAVYFNAWAPLPMDKASMFVQGIDMEDNPVEYPDFNCIRCATAMKLANIKDISHWYKDKLLTHTIDEAMKTGMAYAMREKTA